MLAHVDACLLMLAHVDTSWRENQRLEYLLDQEPYDKAGHLYAVQLQEEKIVVLDR